MTIHCLICNLKLLLINHHFDVNSPPYLQYLSISCFATSLFLANSQLPDKRMIQVSNFNFKDPLQRYIPVENLRISSHSLTSLTYGQFKLKKKKKQMMNENRCEVPQTIRNKEKSSGSSAQYTSVGQEFYYQRQFPWRKQNF